MWENSAKTGGFKKKTEVSLEQKNQNALALKLCQTFLKIELKCFENLVFIRNWKGIFTESSKQI